jgi:hypothetical protein
MAKAAKRIAGGTETEATPWTMSVPAAGKRYFGLGKYASYQAAAEGTIPTIKIGRLMKALPRQIERKLAGDSTD